MNKVPHCKDCKYYRYMSVSTKSTGSIDTTNLKDMHVCKADKNSYKRIKSNEMKVSPKWCPLRKAEL